MQDPVIGTEPTKLFDTIGGIKPRLSMDEFSKFSVTEARNRYKNLEFNLIWKDHKEIKLMIISLHILIFAEEISKTLSTTNLIVSLFRCQLMLKTMQLIFYNNGVQHDETSPIRKKI